MTRYWWVNHSQTFRQEIDGKYLWSPKKEANGSRSQFYENMRSANIGDYVLSFANTEISYVGRVLDYAISAPKPEEFGNIGSNWSAEGWLLPIIWGRLSKPIRPKDRIKILGPLLPEKYSPLSKLTGNGHQKAYFAEINEVVFKSAIGNQNETLEQLALTYIEVESLINSEQLGILAEKAVLQDAKLDKTEKDQLIIARKGQGIFRSNVGKMESGCRVTGINTSSLLIASHIKPWRSCANSFERLDGNNGLLLAPHIDHLFDRGLLSFSNDGRPLVSKHLSSFDIEQFGLNVHFAKTPKAFTSKQAAYLEFHRSNIFLEEI